MIPASPEARLSLGLAALEPSMSDWIAFLLVTLLIVLIYTLRYRLSSRAKRDKYITHTGSSAGDDEAGT